MRLLMACGSTGGHIRNAINLASYLRNRSNKIDVEFILVKNLEFIQILRKENFSYHLISAKATPKRFGFGYFSFIIKLLQSFFKSVIILHKIKPDVIIGFGSYASVPVILANLLRFKKAKVILHEQNVVGGRANIFLSRLADEVAVSFKETQNYFHQKIVFTGNPLKEDLKEVTKERSIDSLALDRDKFTIVILGGSQGSNFINQLMIKTMKDLDRKVKDDIQIIHLTGHRNYKLISREYKNINFKAVKIFNFLENIEYALTASDLIISRAGAGVLSEIAALGRAMILIPYPYAKGHQQNNAEYFRNHGAAIVLQEDNLHLKDFKRILIDLIYNKDKLERMNKNSKRLANFKANEVFYELIFNI